ncbi:MAG: dipeptidyl peptidase 3 [Candidatus Babeliaceae bacterium]|nr:dipeptidyl peptidase 3 [Candidatus Babeliaceae bacterium]
MKKIISMLLICMSSNVYWKVIMAKKLDVAPERLEQFKEIATQYNAQLPELWNNLAPEERIFAYYLYRASIPGNRINSDQTHRHALKITEIFETIIHNKDLIKQKCAQDFDADTFLQEAETFLLYLYAHHSHYFLKEFEDHKRTPERLQLKMLILGNIVIALKAIDVHEPHHLVNNIRDSLFDASYEPTVTVEGSIEQSAGNYYSQDFTEADFESLESQDKVALNVYSYIGSDSPRIAMTEKYKIGGKYSQELEIAHYWLTKAQDHALRYPGIFDKHIPTSLKHMLTYLETGNEEDFRKFSIEWLKTTSTIDFNFGFIEVYQDPKQFRGEFQADVTIKAVDMKKINELLPVLERALPFPEEFKRKNLYDAAAIPNASVNAKIFASGALGPIKLTAAYCLPNYTDIRAEHGSKQIIYQFGKGLGELINPALALRLFSIKEHADWLERHDPQGKLNHDIWDVHVLLHETLGHGSGRDAEHVFVEGDPLTIAGTSYAIGDTIAVTSDNSTEFIGEYSSALEELRAEIIALYTSIFNYDELDACGLYKDWTKKIGKKKLIEWFIIHMAQSGLNRLMVQADGASEIVQAHARADTTIMNYLIDHGGLELVEEQYSVNGIEYTVVGLRVTDLPLAMKAVADLAFLVQRCKSTADGQAVQALMQKYGICVRYPKYIKTLKENRQALQGDLKEIAEIFPRFTPEINSNGSIIDINAEWPASFLEQNLELSRLALSKE